MKKRDWNFIGIKLGEYEDFLEFEKKCLKLYDLRKRDALIALRNDAFVFRNPWEFVYLCNLLGFESEDKDMLQRGGLILDSFNKRQRKEDLENRLNKLLSFLDATQNINRRARSTHPTAVKAELLMNYFPKDFQGKDLIKWPYNKVDALFKKKVILVRQKVEDIAQKIESIHY